MGISSSHVRSLTIKRCSGAADIRRTRLKTAFAFKSQIIRRIGRNSKSMPTAKRFVTSNSNRNGCLPPTDSPRPAFLTSLCASSSFKIFKTVGRDSFVAPMISSTGSVSLSRRARRTKCSFARFIMLFEFATSRTKLPHFQTTNSSNILSHYSCFGG